MKNTFSVLLGLFFVVVLAILFAPFAPASGFNEPFNPYNWHMYHPNSKIHWQQPYY